MRRICFLIALSLPAGPVLGAPAEHRVLIAGDAGDLEKQLNAQAAQGWEFAATLAGEPGLVDELLSRADWGGSRRRLVVLRRAADGALATYRVVEDPPLYLGKKLVEAGRQGFHLRAAEPDQKSVEGSSALVVLERRGTGSAEPVELHALWAGPRKPLEKQLAALLGPGKGLRGAIPLGVGALAVEIAPALGGNGGGGNGGGGGDVLYLDDKLYRSEALEKKVAAAAVTGREPVRLWVEGDRVTVLMVRAPAAPRPPRRFAGIDDGMIGLSCTDGAAVASDVDGNENELVCALLETPKGERSTGVEIEIRPSLWGQTHTRDVAALIESGLAKVTPSSGRCLHLERLIGWRPKEDFPRLAAVFVPCF